MPNKNEKGKINQAPLCLIFSIFFLSEHRTSLQSSRTTTFTVEVRKQLNYPIYIYLIVSLGSNKLTFKGLV